MAVSIMNLIRALVSQLRETQALACGGGDGVRTKTIISPKFQKVCPRVYNYIRHYYMKKYEKYVLMSRSMASTTMSKHMAQSQKECRNVKKYGKYVMVSKMFCLATPSSVLDIKFDLSLCQNFFALFLII